MKMKTVDGVTTLFLGEFVPLDEFDLPIGRLVRIEGNDELFVVEAEDSCAGCALDPDAFGFPAAFCDAFACCRRDRRDETDVVLRRVDDSTSNEETEPPFK